MPTQKTVTFTPPRVAIVGGGLAGLAAAVRLAEHGAEVEIFEARRALGGRAGSYWDKESETWIDHCQHVGMGCCTNLRDFFKRTGCSDAISHERAMIFLGPDGERATLQATPLLPAPLHLARSLGKLSYLSKSDRRSIQRAMLKLAKLKIDPEPERQTFAHWLQVNDQSKVAMERFWKVAVVSALSENLDRVDLQVAKKVFVDGFFRHRDAYIVDIPRVSLSELYDKRVANHLRTTGVKLHLSASVAGIQVGDYGCKVELGNLPSDEQAGPPPFDAIVVALPWRQLPRVLSAEQIREVGVAGFLDKVESAPITGVHLWFDREFSADQHVVLIERLSQWVFRRKTSGLSEVYYQVVISASRELDGRLQSEVIKEIVEDLRYALMPAAPVEHLPKLLRWKMITERNAVFSPEPGLEQFRPTQVTSNPRLFLAGDWTATGWPATMESAVRSGYLAAEGVLKLFDQQVELLVEDLPASWLTRWLGVN